MVRLPRASGGRSESFWNRCCLVLRDLGSGSSAAEQCFACIRSCLLFASSLGPFSRPSCARSHECGAASVKPGSSAAAEDPELHDCILCKKQFELKDLGGRWNQRKCKPCAALEMKVWRQIVRPSKNLSAEEKRVFYRASGEQKEWPTIQAHMTDVLTSRAVSFEKESEKGEYLPATVYLAKGFTQDHIDSCQDRRDHPNLGETIRIPIQSRTTGEIREKITEELNQRVKEVRKKKGDSSTKD